MEPGKTKENCDGVDKTLIAMFLKLTPEERIRANDNAINAVRELKMPLNNAGNHVCYQNYKL